MSYWKIYQCFSLQRNNTTIRCCVDEDTRFSLVSASLPSFRRQFIDSTCYTFCFSWTKRPGREMETPCLLMPSVTQLAVEPCAEKENLPCSFLFVDQFLEFPTISNLSARWDQDLKELVVRTCGEIYKSWVSGLTPWSGSNTWPSCRWLMKRWYQLGWSLALCRHTHHPG